MRLILQLSALVLVLQTAACTLIPGNISSDELQELLLLGILMNQGSELGDCTPAGGNTYELAADYGSANFQAWSCAPSTAASLDVDFTGLENSTLYVVYSNVGEFSTTLNGGLGSGSYGMQSAPTPPPVETENITYKPEIVKEFNNSIQTLVPDGSSTNVNTRNMNFVSSRDKTGNSVGGTTHVWHSLSLNNNVNTTLRSMVTARTGRTVKFWVEDSAWGDANMQINSSKLSHAVSRFVSNTPSIYDINRTVAGDEWGGHIYGNLISSATDTLHVVFLDIYRDGAYGVVGYFYGCNNFSAAALPIGCVEDNAALVFYLDAPTYGLQSGGTWDITDDGPQTILGTMAHEFQHMINFYQKNVRGRASSETWLNEMASEMMEDFAAVYVGGAGTGPAKEVGGRLSLFVSRPTCDITVWSASNGCSILDRYETAFSFGGFLSRQHGGSIFTKAMVQSGAGDMEAVNAGLYVAGAGVSWRDAFRRWGATLAMDPALGTLPRGYGYPDYREANAFGVGHDLHLEETSPYDFQPTYQPRIYDTPPSTIQAYSNVVHRISIEQTGAQSVKVQIPENVRITIVVGPENKP